MAHGKRLDRFTDIAMIDRIVKESNGAYTHDEVFELELGFCYNLNLMYYEQSMYQRRYNMHEREFNKQE